MAHCWQRNSGCKRRIPDVLFPTDRNCSRRAVWKHECDFERLRFRRHISITIIVLCRSTNWNPEFSVASVPLWLEFEFSHRDTEIQG